MWLSAIKLAVQAGSLKFMQTNKKQNCNVRCTTSSRRKTMARGEEAYQGKLLEARQNDY